MPPASNQLSSSAETLSLARGLYLFSVRSAAPKLIGEDQEIVLPALHVGPAPGTPADQIEIMTGPRTAGNWLCDPKDTLIVKVRSGPAILVLTSLRMEGMSPLSVDVQRLDGRAVAPAAIAPSAPQPPTPALEPVRTPQPAANVPAARSLRLQVTAHVQRRGDIQYPGAAWAGVIGQRLAIEAFSVMPLEGLSPDDIEYKALTGTGVETPWISAGAPCGTRGISVPLVGFAVRVKHRPGTPVYICEYRGAFASGKTTGPYRNGTPCRSVLPDDPLEGIHLSILPRAAPGAQPLPPALNEPSAEEAQPRQRAPRRKQARPRFSVFREPTDG